jgi:hypothetical protein
LGVAFFAPPTEDLRRHALAGALALAINAALLALILFLPRPPLPATQEPDAIDVTFVTLPPPVRETAVRSEPETLPDPVDMPEADTAARAAPETPPRPAADVEPVAQDAGPAEDSEETGDDSPAAPAGETDRPVEFIGEALPFPAGPGSTEFAVREIFCLSSSDANRDAFRCPPPDGSEGLPMLQFADPEDIARAEAAFAGLNEEQIRALFAGRGLPVRDLTGQPTLADPAARPTTSADQMRDTLPPLHPDPAFGD